MICDGQEMPFRDGLHPLCPDHSKAMSFVPDSDAFGCPELGCKFRFARQVGYFTLENGKILPNHSIELLRPALVQEHGYLCISEINRAAKTRTWCCTVRDCPN